MIDNKEQGAWWLKGLRIPLILFMGVTFCISSGELGSSPAQNEEHKLVLGFMDHLFAEVRAADAMAAMKVWATEIKRKEGFDGAAETRLFHDLDSMVRAVQDGEVDLVILLSQDYIDVAGKIDIEPHYVVHRGGSLTEQSVLLVHNKTGIHELAQLQNENLIVLNDSRANMGRIWIETLLFDKGFLNLESFFGKIKNTGKCSKAVLPIYFRQSMACLIHRSGFG